MTIYEVWSVFDGSRTGRTFLGSYKTEDEARDAARQWACLTVVVPITREEN